MRTTTNRPIQRVFDLLSAGLIRSVTAAGLGLAFAAIATAATPAWIVEQFYTNVDGSIQFVVFSTSESGQQHLAGHTLIASKSAKSGASTGRPSPVAQAFTFPHDLPADSANRAFLVGTRGFADLQLVRPDYVVPNNFFPVSGGTLSMAGVEAAQYASPPTDGMHALHSLGNGWVADIAEPTNFAGEQHTLAGEQWVVEATRAPASVNQTLSPGPLPGWRLVDGYSSADHTIQFVVFTTPTSGLQFLRGQRLTSGSQLEPLSKIYIFPSNLPGDSAGHSVLIGTRSFANLGVVPPDYIVPDRFFLSPPGRPFITMGQNSFMLAGSFGWNDASVATNYAGQSYTLVPGAPVPQPQPQPPPPPKSTCPYGPWWCTLFER